ncbi:MAG: hypothetical protein R3F53_18275 [Gammaproteobacteria bacterium]
MSFILIVRRSKILNRKLAGSIFEQTRAYLGLSENDAKAYLLSKLRKQEILWCSHPLHYVERGIRDGKYPITLGLNPDYEVQRKLSQWEKSRIGQLPLSHADPLARLKLIISDPVTVDEFLLDYPTDDRQGLRDKIAKAIASGLLHSARLPIAVAGSDGPGYKTYFSRQQVNDWLKQDKSDNDIRAENLLPTELVGHGDTIESKQNSSGAIPGPKELSRRFFQAEKCKDFAARNTALQELFMHYYRQSKKKQVAILETRNTLVNSPHGFSKITPERIRRLVRVQKL